MPSLAHILVVDDDLKLSEMLKEYLGRHDMVVSAYDTIATGRDAIVKRQADHGLPKLDLILLDISLPDGNGLDLCRDLRAKYTTPIIMLTARGDDTDRIVGLELGADDYLAKPFNPRELVARIRAVLRRGAPKSLQGDTITFGPLTLNKATRAVHKNGKALDLTGRQFDILALLMARRGRVQSREEIMQAVSGDAYDTFDRSVDVHVSRIRAAIEDNPKKPQFLKSVRGAGYVFSAQAAALAEPGLENGGAT